jgi:hypothetical protein
MNYLKRQLYKPLGKAQFAYLVVDSEAFRTENEIITELSPENSHLYGAYLESLGYSLDEREAVIQDHHGDPALIETLIMILALKNDFQVHFLGKSREARKSQIQNKLDVFLNSKEAEGHLKSMQQILECQVFSDILTKEKQDKKGKKIILFIFL